VHLTESELAALTHGDESGRPEAMPTHLASCPDCTARLKKLRADDREVSELLLDVDHAAPRIRGATFLVDLQRRRRRIASIAAGLALFAAGAAAALPNSPLHRVLVRALSTNDSGSDTSAPVIHPAPRVASAGVAFIPGSSLDVRFRDPHPGGHLRVLLVDGPHMSAAATGDAAFSIHQSLLEVTDRGVAMTFTLEIPRGVPSVTIRTGDEIIFEKRAGAISGSHPMDSTGAYVFEFGGAR
jgi:hypothetical protein